MKQSRMNMLILVMSIFTGWEHEKENDHDDHSHSTASTLNR